MLSTFSTCRELNRSSSKIAAGSTSRNESVQAFWNRARLTCSQKPEW
jgi:hypothetical protein